MAANPLVRLDKYLANPIFDLRYAQSNNFTGHALYKPGFTAQMLEDAASALAESEAFFITKGYRLVIWDCYRPKAVQAELRAMHPDDRYVRNKSLHVAGRAVDVSLATREGTYLDMGTNFDSFTPKAHANATGLTDVQQANRSLLLLGMTRGSFKQWPYEWWHFDYI